jgi:voltage-gated potassium channel Kch
MAIYHATFSAAGVNAADGVLFNLKTAATDRAILREVGFFIETASTNAPQYGLKRMSAVGTGTITTATAGLSDSGDGAASCTLETAWATARPTVTGGAFRRAMVANTIGNGIIFDFTNRGILVPVSAGLCGVMLNAAGATLGVHGGYVVWEE